MSNIVDITNKLIAKEEYKKEEKYFQNHSYVLEMCEDIFPNGVIILELDDDGGINVSTSIEDQETIIEALVSTAVKIAAQADFEELEE